MNRTRLISLILGLSLLPALGALPALAQGPDYQIEAYTVAGGSGELSGGDYSLGGTAGQAEANPAALGGVNYSLWPGFWQAMRGSGGPVTIYLPLIVKNYLSAPDLVITALNAAGPSLTVTVKNQGNGPVIDAFWLDVYFNPTETPTVNQPWDSIAPAGATWGVATNLSPGGTLTLTVGDAWYVPQYSSGSFPTGSQVYAYVDSVDHTTSYGAVRESNEGNNLFGPVASAAGNEAAAVSGADKAHAVDDLPPR